MNQELIQTLAEIGVVLEASETRLAIRAVDQARLRSASRAYMEETGALLPAAGMDMQALAAQGIGVEVVNDHHFILYTADKGKLTASLEAARKAEFYQMIMQAEAAWEEAEAEEEYDWREDVFSDDGGE